MMRKTSVILLSAATGAALTLFVTQPRTVLMMGSSARAATSDTYRQLNLFGDVFERVRSDYVEKPDDGKLVESAISGMLTGLDPHSSYMDASSFQDMSEKTRGEFGGLGIEVTMENGLVKVVAPYDGTPAAKAGIQANRFVREYGLRLLPHLYEVYNPMPYEAAREMEVELAIGLREAGYGVWQA